MQCSPSFFIWNWKRQIGNRTFTVQVPGDLRDKPIVYPCWADQPQRSSVIKNLRDDNLAGWYSHINHRKQNTIEFHSWWWWEVEGVDLYFCVAYEHVGVFMINYARSFYSSFLWVSIVWCIATLWIFFVGRQSRTRGVWQYETTKYSELMSLLWFDNLCLSWSLLGGQGMNARIWF